MKNRTEKGKRSPGHPSYTLEQCLSFCKIIKPHSEKKTLSREEIAEILSVSKGVGDGRASFL
ncbi:MAG: hypothetical protein QM710_00855 [Flavobacterium sp.]